MAVVRSAVGLMSPKRSITSLLHNRWEEPAATPALSSGHDTKKSLISVDEQHKIHTHTHILTI